MEIRKEHAGHVVQIGDETHMRFRVSGTLINDSFSDFSTAIAAIDDALRKHEAQTRKRIAVRVLDASGSVATITGIHAGNGSILGISDAAFFPDVTWIKEALVRSTALRSEVSVIDKKLEPFRMSRYSIGSRRNPHNELVDALVKLIDQTTQAAAQAAPAKEYVNAR